MEVGIGIGIGTGTRRRDYTVPGLCLNQFIDLKSEERRGEWTRDGTREMMGKKSNVYELQTARNSSD